MPGHVYEVSIVVLKSTVEPSWVDSPFPPVSICAEWPMFLSFQYPVASRPAPEDISIFLPFRVFSLVSMLPRVDPSVCTSRTCQLLSVTMVVSLVRSAWLYLWFPEFIFPSFQRGHKSVKLAHFPGFESPEGSSLVSYRFPACLNLFFNLARASGFANNP